jgi:hypothetical protein
MAPSEWQPLFLSMEARVLELGLGGPQFSLTVLRQEEPAVAVETAHQ